MLEFYHAELKKVILFFFKAWRLDFLPKTKWKALNFLRLSIYPLCAIFACFCEAWHFFFQINNYNDLMDVSFTISIGIAMYQCIMIYLIVHVGNKNRILGVLDYFESLILSKDNLMIAVRTKHLENSTRIAYICSRYILRATFGAWFVIAANCTYWSGFSSPMLYDAPGLPEDSIFFYPVNLIHQFVIFFTSYELLMFSDVVILIMIMYCQAELKAITELLSRLSEENIAVEEGTMILRKAYEVHSNLSHYSSNLTKSFWHVYLQKLLAMMLYLCSMLLCFQSTDSIPIGAILSIVIILTQVFIMCFFGQILMNSSEHMAKAIYMTKWYEMSVKDQKTMLILMMRFNLPVKVETFAFGTISNFTFVQICKASVSYAAILYTVLQ